MVTGGMGRSDVTIMVADDDEDIRVLLAKLLQGEGYRVIEAASGEEAVQSASRQSPHLILMDIAMPGMDGMSAVWRIRRQAESADIPVVIVSAFDSYDLRAEAAGAGCAGYLVKPVDPERLKSLVKEIVGKRDKRRAEGREEAAAEAYTGPLAETVLARPTVLTVLERLHRLEARLSSRLDRIEGAVGQIHSELSALRADLKKLRSAPAQHPAQAGEEKGGKKS